MGRFQYRVKETLSNKSKIFWLTDEENINKKLGKKENLEDRFLNDTRSATKIMQTILNTIYSQNKMNMEKVKQTIKLIRVTGKAISEQKRLWGVDKSSIKNEEWKR